MLIAFIFIIPPCDCPQLIKLLVMKLLLLMLGIICLLSCNENKSFAPDASPEIYYRKTLDSSVLRMANIREIDSYNLTLTSGKRGSLYIHFKLGGDTTWTGLSSQDVSALGVILKEKFIAYNTAREEIFGVSQLTPAPPVALKK